MENLLDIVDSYSEEHRFNCELRYIASLDLSERRKYLDVVLQKKGIFEANRLKEGLISLWKTK